MNIHEYQGKDVLRKYGVTTPRGFACFSADEAADAATRLGGRAWVVKAQIHAGGRGKGGGVKLAWSADEVRRHASQMLGMTLKTHQTGPEGRVVKRLLVEEGIEIDKEFYLAMVVDRESGRVALMASSEGGMDIEEVAARTPGKIHKVLIDPATGLKGSEADIVARSIGLSGKSVMQARTLMQNLYQAFDASDASLAEINPLVVTRDGRVIALDAKFNFDANALFASPRSWRCATSTRKTRPRSRPRVSISRTSRWTATSAAW
jgi:succinyl-CoA synthetase beta subunit